MIKIQNLASFIYILANAFDPKERIPGKNIRWDPRCVPGGIPPFSGGIPGGIMEHPAWNPTWDYGTSHMGSHLGLWNILHGIPPGIMEHSAWDPTWDYGTSPMGFCQLNLGSRLKFLIASHLGKHIPGRIKHRIPPIPLGILPQISDSFPPGKSYPRRDCIWDPANPSLDPA